MKRNSRQTREIWSFFDIALSIQETEIALIMSAVDDLPWADHILNPRRIRGSDFLMRWSQGRWSEERIVEAIDNTGRFIAVPYGPSGVAPQNIEEAERYFERLEKAGLGKIKRPDLLVLPSAAKEEVDQIVAAIGGFEELPFMPESEPKVRRLLSWAIVAIECENSLWIAKKMPDYGLQLTPQRRLGGKKGLKKTAVVPTIILKEEDREPLRRWQIKHGIPVHIWHLFYDIGYGISLNNANKLIKSGLIEKTQQVFQAPSGAITRKIIYRIYYHYGYLVGETIENPIWVADSIVDKNGHILPYVRFEGGKIRLSQEALEVLEQLAQARHGRARHGSSAKTAAQPDGS